ncbi:hypothetical protein SISNIDRAFT_350913 [Sistotremastrum niveocremeum HHB9708]|uniref:DUF6535 domain-containing protein n=1 Tax=Sistotremastrum niveocremeum HHB9708 TaxID=1314777 RepID=A0A164WZK1_9AGAM|nr:hypothetical protein SISNIDRAFT_350913 [Sistotremastrum niveocremeum HHB9708]
MSVLSQPGPSAGSISQEQTCVKDPFDTPVFNRLLTLIEQQNATMEEQKKTLMDHGSKLDMLVKDAVKDDQPYDEEENPVWSEQMWSGVYEIATATMKEKADEWKGLMDVSLVFIAIFLTVLTAFLVPATQALSPTSSSNAMSNSTTADSRGPLPPSSDQNVCALYYMSLMTAMCNAVLCVLGRQWVGKLLSRPAGETHRERTMRHEQRKRLANVWIKPLIGFLYWSLLLSIALFITGLLYQLRNLATSFDEDAVALQVAWSFGIVLSAVIVGTILASSIHAVRFESSPFEGLLSKFIVKIIGFVNRRWLWDWRVHVQCHNGKHLFNTYMQLISEANDPKLLDRAVQSFSYSAWLQYGESSTELLERAYTRLMASDTSVRVRETVKSQIYRLARFIEKHPWYSTEDTAPKLQVDHFSTFIAKHYSCPDDLPAYATIISCHPYNYDLMEVGTLPLAPCIAKIVCTYDQDAQIGERSHLFTEAVQYCDRLAFVGNDEVSRILSHVEPVSFVRSLLRSRPTAFLDCRSVEFVMKGHETGILVGVNELFQNGADVNHQIIPYVLRYLFKDPSALVVGVDFSPLIAHIAQNPTWHGWESISDAVVPYVDQSDLSTFSNPAAIFNFLELCIALEPRREDYTLIFLPTSPATEDLARAILARHARHDLIPLPPSTITPFSNPASFEGTHPSRCGSDPNSSSHIDMEP